MKRLLIHVPTWTLLLLACTVANAQTGRTVARLFWQDESTATIRWGDLRKSGQNYSIEEQSVDGFPVLNDAEQSLVQMVGDDGMILVGVHDQADGTIGSGWVAIETGLIQQDHGDHSHWILSAPPTVVASHIDGNQGNPAHVYLYDNLFVLANDKKNGFTLTSARSIRDAQTPQHAATFVEGGNGHITLAVVEDQVAYATWIAPVGDDSGRVDVIGLAGNSGKQYSFRCPTGGLHGATVNEGKVFFAPSDGICYVEVDAEMDDDPDTIEVNHLSLGKDPDDRPLRTGAFKTIGKHVLFTAGKGEQSKLCWVDASSAQPAVVDLPLNAPENQSVSLSLALDSPSQGPMAVVFGESKDDPETDQLWMVSLDPNHDGNFDDAVVKSPVTVGPNQLRAHAGQHSAAVLPNGRHVAITNPGDASIWVLSLTDSSVVAKLNVTGTPARMWIPPQG